MGGESADDRARRKDEEEKEGVGGGERRDVLPTTNSEWAFWVARRREGEVDQLGKTRTREWEAKVSRGGTRQRMGEGKTYTLQVMS